jgi:hypothetical protein
MRLSELVAQYGNHDPVLMVEGEDGIPRPVVDVDLGVMRGEDLGTATYVLLEAARDPA